MNKYTNHTKEIIVMVLLIIGILGFVAFSAWHYEDCLGGVWYHASEAEGEDLAASSGQLLPGIAGSVSDDPASPGASSDPQSQASVQPESPAAEDGQTAPVQAVSPIGAIVDVTAAPVPDTGLAVTFLNVGQGDAALITCDGMSMLIDGGGVESGAYVSAYLKARGISSLNYVVATHPHADHVGGLSEVFKGCSVGQVYVPVLSSDACPEFTSFMQYTSATGTNVAVPDVGGKLFLGSAEVQFLGPTVYDAAEMNNNSLVMKIRYGTTSFLFTGDAEAVEEDCMIQAGFDLSANVLKVSHHGGADATSDAFLAAVHPTSAIISCAEVNDYGHPSPEVLQRLDMIGCVYYETFLSGCITAVSDGTNINWNFER